MKIAMWSGPRNISTAIMRSFGNRSDTFISDEPLYGYYLKNNKIIHPMKNEIIQKMETDFFKIKNYLIGTIPNEKSIWYQKHMAHHLSITDDLCWINSLINILLIRNPKDVILSYVKKNELNDIIQLGLPQQQKIFQFVSNNNIKCLIIDADDLLKNPKKILLKLCNEIQIIFDEKMLNWETGSKNYDGIWGKYWYDNANNSTEFKLKIYDNAKKNIPKSYFKIYEKSMGYYKNLKKYRITT
jgi:hypothetical protein